MKISSDGNTITVRIPDEWHAHLRQGWLLVFLVEIFLRAGWRGRILLEPNITPAITTGSKAVHYRKKVRQHAVKHPHGRGMTPVMTIQITESTTKEMIYAAKRRGVRIAKVYPKWVTTNSENGVENYGNIIPALEACAEVDIIVQFHAQHPSFDYEGFEKEIQFLKRIAVMIQKEVPGLKFTIEHIGTAYGVHWVLDQGENVGGGIAIQHIVDTIDDCIGYSPRTHGKICVHNGFKPHAGLRKDRRAIQKAVLSGHPRLWSANDPATHLSKNKHCAEGACGAANMWATLPELLSFFIKNGKTELFEPFTSEHGARFYGFPLNKGTITFVRKRSIIPKSVPVPHTGDVVIPWHAGEDQEWEVVE